MKALILAAGFGSRLMPITENLPKCLVKVNGKAILEQQISCLTSAGIEEIFVVGGYKISILNDFLSTRFPNIKLIENEKYNSTNNMFSLALAESHLSGESFLLLNGDVYLSEDIISGILNDKNSNLVAVEQGRFIEESMKVTLENNKLTSISKAITEKDAYGVSIDVYKFGTNASKTLFSIADNFINQRNERNLWTEFAINESFKVHDFLPYNIKGKWYEIDNHEDLKAAELLFGSENATK